MLQSVAFTPGVGKTRLATEVAAGLADEFPDGVWVVELAVVTDPTAVSDAVAAVLNTIQQLWKERDRQHCRSAGRPSPVAGVR